MLDDLGIAFHVAIPLLSGLLLASGSLLRLMTACISRSAGTSGTPYRSGAASMAQKHEFFEIYQQVIDF
ncbi:MULTISPECIES: hypothetical protein [unclassified Cobetia]|uniref:hypothetical protein n=1 Tax=unclassified Cobetia TaxID=2609414 RepID=UPI0019F27D1E|nr:MULTISPECIES: hypothetical protein [unclassified Cobetia]MBE2168887.1 hypothetical protein [Cobetia sp. 2AS1]